MADHSQLLDRVRERAEADHSPPAPLVASDALAQAEAQLGFALHPLLAAVYREIGDGGFGPDYQLLPLAVAGGESVVSAYTSWRATYAGTAWAWPEGVVPILTWGCGMYACVDCRDPNGMVLLFEPNPGDPDLAWYIDSPSFAAWLTHYADDTGWWIAAEEGEDPQDLQPWLHAPERARQ